MKWLSILKSERRRKVLLTAIILLAPNFLGFLVFTLGPVVFSIGMSFTDWNLARHTSGTIPIKFVGLKNYQSLLGFHRHPLSPSSEYPITWLIAFFVLIALLLGVLYLIWRLRTPQSCMDSNPSGRYWILVVVGFVLLIGVFQTVWTGTWSVQPRLGGYWPILKGMLAMICIWGFARHVGTGYSEHDVRRLTLLSILLFLALLLVRGILIFGEWTFTLWQANTPRFWDYLYNTVFLMLGLPLAIAGSLVMALILHKTVEVAGWWKRIVLAALMLVLGFGGAFILYRTQVKVGFSPDLLALLMAVSVLGALGILFGTTAFRTIFYLPSLSMSVATFILWQKMFNPETGPINSFLGRLFATPPFHVLEDFFRWWQPSLGTAWHLVPPEWLQDPAWSKPALIFMSVWGALGSSNMLLYLAGLSNIAPELYEAANIDGASPWQRFWSVTWPQLAPTTFFIAVMGCIGGLQAGFETARVMTAGGPAGSTTTLSYFLYTEAFELSNMGYGCAIAWVLFLIVFTLTIINWRFGNEMVNYE